MTIYDVLRQPLDTEKSRHQSGKLHQYVFKVDVRATKPQIKDAVEKLFNVSVRQVRIIRVAPKRGYRGRTRRLVERNKAYKKAIVTIRADQKIDVFEGVK